MVAFGKMMLNSASDFEKRNELLQLMNEKNKIELEIKELFEVLSQNNVRMSDPLVDREGFPRNDIDVYQVRIARQKIICLQNDHKSIMAKIEAGLHLLHAGGSQESAMESESEEETKEPFACVSLVSPNSPAELCGLRPGDLLLEFGSVNKMNFTSMQDVATVVQHSTGQKVNVRVKREGRHTTVPLELAPQPWSGPGLIGCKIDPLPKDVVER